MGLIHTRASKKRDKAQAKLLKTERQQLEQEAAQDKPWYQQPTIGDAIRAARQK